VLYFKHLNPFILTETEKNSKEHKNNNEEIENQNQSLLLQPETVLRIIYSNNIEILNDKK